VLRRLPSPRLPSRLRAKIAQKTGQTTLIPQLHGVILSGVTGSRSESVTESKDPYPSPVVQAHQVRVPRFSRSLRETGLLTYSSR